MRVEILSDQEVQIFLTHLDTYPNRDALMMRFMLQAGLRVGEVSGLDVGNVFHHGLVNQAIYLDKASTKSHRTRYVDMPAPLRSLVADYVKQLASQITPLGPDHPLFFSARTKKRIGIRNIQLITAALSKKSLGRVIHPHVLRHTYATTLLKYTDIHSVQQLLGHADISTTSIYLHTNSEDLRRAINQAWTR